MDDFDLIGHHHQITLSMEDKNARIINKLVQPTSFVEGWGLYSEYLGEEMGNRNVDWLSYSKTDN
jgi:uncharacterized protein (DUF885 family)